METKLYTVEEVAGILNLHPKTVVRFIHEGKITARKIGRSWMISGADLKAYAHAELAPGDGLQTAEKPVPHYETLSDRISVSAVIEITEENSEEASRISNSLMAVLNCKDESFGQSRFDFFYYPETQKAKYVLYGSPEFITRILGIFEMLCAQKD
jgi:excisionase family DNA binding protein